MVNFLFSLMIAILLGFLAGMGVGGGSLLLLWLTQVAGFSSPQARLTNLLFYLPAALITTLFHRKAHMLQTKIVLPGVLAGCIGAVLFSLLSQNLDTKLLQKLLGALLIMIGLREIFYRPRNAR